MRPHRRVLRGPPLIRLGRDDDAPRFIALIARCWSEYGYTLNVDVDAPELRALGFYYARSGGALWIADEGEGMIATRPLDENTWEICRVYVMPARHGTGLGRSLLKTAEHHALKAGCRGFRLWTDTRFHRAHGFYAKHGYGRLADTREFCPGVVEYRYEKHADQHGQAAE